MLLRELIRITEEAAPPVDNEKLLAAMQVLQRRCVALLQKMIPVLDQQDQAEASKVHIRIDPKLRSQGQMFSTSPAYARPSQKLIAMGTTFIDAPDEVIIWMLGHELAHILRQHINVDADKKPKPNSQIKQQELEADELANVIMKRLNISKAAVFTWIERERGGIEQQLRIERDIGHIWLPHSTHPGHGQRIDNAKKHGIELSRADLLNNLAELDKLQQTLA
jgi:Zn-dependent protease with chaperone function